MERIKSKTAYEEAIKFIPGGVNSPVRALKSVGEAPLFIRKAKGTTLTDLDGNELIDFCLSWGVFLAGHANDEVNERIHAAVELGSSYGIPTEVETQLARAVNRSFPSMEKIRFVNSGTEAVMSAIRVARGFTGRDLIIKFDGCYHGHADHLLVNAGSGTVSIDNASSAGVPGDFVKQTVSLPYNDIEAVTVFFEKKGNKVAAVILEPVACNMGVILPQEGFLSTLRKLTTAHGALLLFDEVITGFRLSPGGAQQLYNIQPDLTTVGKIIGGGFPAAAFGGRSDIMRHLAPEGNVYQAGTLSGNPVAMSAGLATVTILQREGFYEELEMKSHAFISILKEIIRGKEVQLNHLGSMFTLFFTDKKVENFEDAKQTDTKRFGHFFRRMLKEGIYFSPSQFEGNFISAAHTDEQLERTLDAINRYFNS